MASRHEGDHEFLGNVRFGSFTLPNDTVRNAGVHADAAIVRSKLAQESLVEYPISWREFFKYDDPAAPLPAASTGSHLGLYNGTWGTATPTIATGDVKNTTITRYARAFTNVPAEFDGGNDFQIVFIGTGLLTTLSSGVATLDLEVYKYDEEGLVDGSDLCATAFQSIKSLTLAEYVFNITSAGLSPGDMLDLRFVINIVDSATATPVIGTIGAVKRRCDIRG
jgi:hypothetical protein